MPFVSARPLRDRTRRPVHGLAALVVAALLGFFVFQGLRIASAPAEKIAAWNVVIDDGFYYLQVSRNIARGYGSTFDRINPTNGFQPLWAAALVPIFWITNDPALGLSLALVLATLLGAAAIILFYLALLRLAGLAPALLMTALFCSNSYFLQLLQGGLETPAVFVCVAGLVFYWSRRGRRVLSGRRRACLGFGALLGLVVLARVDVALALGPIALAVVLWPPGGWRLRLARTLWIGLAGAALTVPYVAWNVLVHGSPVPISGLVKRWVIATYQNTQALFERTEQWRGLARTMDLLSFPHGLHKGQTLGDILPALMLPTGLLALLALRLLWRPRLARPALATPLFVGATAGVSAHAAYMYFGYRSCSHWNYHYFFPLALIYTLLLALVVPRLLGDLGRAVDALLGRFAFLQRGWALLALLLVLPPIGFAAQRGKKAAEKRYAEVQKPASLSFRKSRYDAARYLAEAYPKDSVFGAWWAGTLGYFSDQRVVNLDGVVNSHAFFERYLKTDTVQQYIIDGPITHLVDFFWRDPMQRSFHPAWRAFWWEHDKEHIIKRLHARLRTVKVLRYRGGGMWVLRVDKSRAKPKGRTK